MSAFALLMLLAAGVIVFIFVKTLQQEGMKIPSDPEHPGNVLKEQQRASADIFTKTMERADLAFKEGSLHDAEAALESALRMQPENEEVLSKLAYVLEKQGDGEAAAGIYNKALETHKKSYRLWADYALLMERKGDLEKAKELYIEAVQLEPDEPEVYYNFANLLARLGETQAAAQGYARALEEDKNFSPAAEALERLKKAD